MKLFSKKKFKRGGYVGTPTMGTPIPIPLMDSSPIQVDREAHTQHSGCLSCARMENT